MSKNTTTIKPSALIMKNFRKHLGISQGAMSEKMKVSKSYISQIENGKVDLSLSNFFELCKLFNVEDVNFLFII